MLQLTVSTLLRNISCGIPQGSVLRLLLFILYINDITDSTKHSLYSLFSDDTSICYANDDLSNLN